MTIYKRRLKEQVKDEMMRYTHSADINTLNDMIKVLIEINDKLYKRSIEKQHNFTL